MGSVAASQGIYVWRESSRIINNRGEIRSEEK